MFEEERCGQLRKDYETSEEKHQRTRDGEKDYRQPSPYRARQMLSFKFLTLQNMSYLLTIGCTVTTSWRHFKSQQKATAASQVDIDGQDKKNSEYIFKTCNSGISFGLTTKKNEVSFKDLRQAGAGIPSTS